MTYKEAIEKKSSIEFTYPPDEENHYGIHVTPVEGEKFDKYQNFIESQGRHYIITDQLAMNFGPEYTVMWIHVTHLGEYETKLYRRPADYRDYLQ